MPRSKSKRWNSSSSSRSQSNRSNISSRANVYKYTNSRGDALDIEDDISERLSLQSMTISDPNSDKDAKYSHRNRPKRFKEEKINPHFRWGGIDPFEFKWSYFVWSTVLIFIFPFTYFGVPSLIISLLAYTDYSSENYYYCIQKLKIVRVLFTVCVIIMILSTIILIVILALYAFRVGPFHNIHSLNYSHN